MSVDDVELLACRGSVSLKMLVSQEPSAQICGAAWDEYSELTKSD